MNTTTAQNDTARSDTALQAWQRFFSTGLGDKLQRHAQSPEAHMLDLFHTTVQDVPAYRAFLHSRWIKPENIRTFDDFRKLPLLTKENYINRYSLPERCRGGKIEANDMVAVSSGSTGQPTFWLRSAADELEISYRFEQV